MTPVSLQLRKDVRRTLRRGHPWIYDRALGPPPRPLASGELVRIADRERAIAVGFADPDSPIRVRVLSRDPDFAPDDAWARSLAERAGAMRRADPTLAETTAFRAIHGEGDFMPGLVIDVYDRTAVAVLDGAASEAFWKPRIGSVVMGLGDAGVDIAGVWGRRGAGGGGRLLWGEEPPELIAVDENGARFEVDVRRGQKTGLFLDQRDNRLMVSRLSAGAEVLNLFAYTGGFSVHAALGGARRVTTVDVAAPAIEAARANFAASGLDAGAHVFEACDAFDFLDRARARGQCFDLVICDPPSFAPSERLRKKALVAYRRLNAAALSVVDRRGTLVTASCSSHVSEADMLDVLADASTDVGRSLRVQHLRGAGSDHPVLPGFPEGRYLKVLFCHAD